MRHLDLSTYAAVQAFAKQISQELDRIDGFVCNAGIMIDQWETFEGIESSIFVNVVNTLFLGALMMPKLSESARKFSIKPTLVFIVSVLGYTVKAEMDKSRNGSVFDGLNDQKRANMDSRYVRGRSKKGQTEHGGTDAKLPGTLSQSSSRNLLFANLRPSFP